jgi:hypothetical protein
MENRQVLKFLTVLCITIFLSTCGTKQQDNRYRKIAEGIMSSESFMNIDNPDVVTIDNEKAEIIPYKDLNNILKTVKYIPLVSKEPIGEFRKILIYKERIYILDAFIAEKIFIFNIKGEIIKIIDSKGGGPNEYRGLMDMSISTQDDYLVINDRLSPFILYFSLDGEFVKKTRSIFNTTVGIINGKLVNQLNPGQSFDNNINYQLVVTVGDSIIRRGFPFYPLQMDAIFSPPFQYNYKNELLFCPYYCDTIYQIVNDSIYTTKYIIKHRKSIWEKSNESLSFDDYNRLIIQSDYTRIVPPILETKNFVCYPIEAKIKVDESYHRRSYFYWFNKNNKTSFSLEEPQLKTLTESPYIHHLIPDPDAIYGNQYVGILRINVILFYRDVIKALKEQVNYTLFQNKELENMIMDENPNLETILVMYEFKD